ncbi:MAG: hypothetical protein GX422_03565 [Deltaproteobacteria bacterium]|jgi:hypothetical protein|nr:hypothetical protein [Deltaproteobacteria bacterium]
MLVEKGKVREGSGPVWSRCLKAGFLLFSAFMAAGCVSTAGMAEFRLYHESFDRMSVTSATIFDELAAAERAKARELFKKGLPPIPGTRTNPGTIRASGFDEQFYIEDAPYVSSIDDPPATAAFRRSLAAVAGFNSIILAYAEGRSLRELKQEAADLSSTARGALDVVEAAKGIGILNMPAVGAALALVKAGADEALKTASRSAFREAVVAHQPQIDTILVTVRDGTPAIFGLLTDDLADSAKDAMDAGDRRTAEVLISQIETYRRMLSDWVLLLDETRVALDATVAAIQTQFTCDTVMFTRDLSTATEGLRSRTESIRAAIVTLRRGFSSP